MSDQSKQSNYVKLILSVIVGVVVVALAVWMAAPSSSNPVPPPARNDANSVSVLQGNLLLVQQIGDDGHGHQIHTGAPVAVIVTGTPTIDDLCRAAVAVNSYGADHPEQEAASLRNLCQQAQANLDSKNYDNCSQDLIHLGRNVNTSYNGHYRLDLAFTNGNIDRACSNDVSYGNDLRSSTLNESVLH